MKFRTWVTIGAIAFGAWRSMRNVRKTVKKNARTTLKRAQKAIA